MSNQPQDVAKAPASSVPTMPGQLRELTTDALRYWEVRRVFIAVLANLAFSVVYVGDVFIQFSGFRESRARWRWVLLLVGFAFAGVLAHFFSTGMFDGPRQP